MITRSVRFWWLLAGDALAVLVVTMIGFLTHYSGIRDWRWLTTFLPVLAAWLVFAPWFGAYRLELVDDPRQVWRPALAALLCAPLAATLRGFWLNTVILPVFVVVLGVTSALGILLWRFGWAALIARRAARQAGVGNG